MFELRGELHLVAVGDRVPGTRARLVHVTDASIQITYPATAASEGGVLILERNGIAPGALPRDTQAAMQQLQITPLTVDPESEREMRARQEAGSEP